MRQIEVMGFVSEVRVQAIEVTRAADKNPSYIPGFSYVTVLFDGSEIELAWDQPQPRVGSSVRLIVEMED